MFLYQHDEQCLFDVLIKMSMLLKSCVFVSVCVGCCLGGLVLRQLLYSRVFMAARAARTRVTRVNSVPGIKAKCVSIQLGCAWK